MYLLKHKTVFLAVVFLLFLLLTGCNNQKVSFLDDYKQNNNIESVRLNWKIVISASISKVEENWKEIKNPHITYSQENFVELQAIVDAIQKAKNNSCRFTPWSIFTKRSS